MQIDVFDLAVGCLHHNMYDQGIKYRVHRVFRYIEIVNEWRMNISLMHLIQQNDHFKYSVLTHIQSIGESSFKRLTSGTIDSNFKMWNQ